jgi:hypothetical protein
MHNQRTDNEHAQGAEIDLSFVCHVQNDVGIVLAVGIVPGWVRMRPSFE